MTNGCCRPPSLGMVEEYAESWATCWPWFSFALLYFLRERRFVGLSVPAALAILVEP